MFGRIYDLMKEMIQELQQQQSELLAKMTPKERAEFNVFEQKRKKIMQLPIHEQEEALRNLAKEYGVDSSK